MISIWCWPLISRSKLLGFWHACLLVWPVTFFCFDIDLPYLAHRSIIMRECVVYIHDFNMTLAFNLMVKYIEFLTCLHVRLVTSSCFEVVILYLAHWSITVRGCTLMIQIQRWLWPEGRIYWAFDMVLCLGHSFLAHLSQRLKWAILIKNYQSLSLFLLALS